MAQLPDVPAAGLKVILRLLSLQDYASLRLVSRSLYQCITQHVPYISLLLTYTSGDEQLYQWFRATEKLQHVSSVHVHMPASPAAEVFELALQLLSQRTAIIELHLLSAGEGCWSSCEKTHIETLQPVEHLLPRLKTLVIDGIAVINMVDDLQHLAAAAAGTGTGGWQLESLTLQADWRQWVDYHRINHWSEYAAALKHLTQAFPNLKYLSMSKPEMMYRLLPPQAAAADSSISYSVSDTLSRTGVTTAVANAVMQLQHLEVLHLTDALDVWMLDLINAADGDRDSLIERLRSRSGAKSNDSDFMQAVDIADACIGNGPLVSVQDAAAAFPTFDDYGCWMLQQHPKLKVVSINCESKGWAMTWQQQQQALYPSSSSSSTCCTLAAAAAETEAPVITSMTCRWDACSRQRTRRHGQPYYGNDATLTDDFIRHLSRYSSRSADMLFCHVSNMRLSLYDQDVDQLGDLLSNLKSLKHLEISVEPRRTNNGANKVGEVAPAAAAAAGIFMAAATVTGLQSLTVRLEGRDYDALPDDLLLPLTAAAGGPGSNLQKLVLIGCSATPAAAAAAAQAAEYGSGWLHALKQLTGLTTLWYLPCAPDDTKYHSFLVECLPEGLKMFRGRNLYITSSSSATAAAPAAVASSSDEKHSTAVIVFGGSTPCAAALASLFLERCVLSSPSLLASQQMQHLTLDCSWSGDWTAAAMAAAAAAAVWPYARSLRWMFNNSSSNSAYASATMLQDEDSSAQSGGQSFSIHTDTDTDIEVDTEVETQLKGIYVIREIAENFKYLRSIALHHFPYLNIENVQPLLQKLGFLQHVEFDGGLLHGTIMNPMTKRHCFDLMYEIADQLPWISACFVGPNTWTDLCDLQ